MGHHTLQMLIDQHPQPEWHAQRQSSKARHRLKEQSRWPKPPKDIEKLPSNPLLVQKLIRIIKCIVCNNVYRDCPKRIMKVNPLPGRIQGSLQARDYLVGFLLYDAFQREDFSAREELVWDCSFDTMLSRVGSGESRFFDTNGMVEVDLLRVFRSNIADLFRSRLGRSDRLH